MYVIYKQVGKFTYYLKEIPIHNIEWVGITDNATKYQNESEASQAAVKHKLHHSQIKKV